MVGRGPVVLNPVFSLMAQFLCTYLSLLYIAFRDGSRDYACRNISLLSDNIAIDIGSDKRFQFTITGTSEGIDRKWGMARVGSHNTFSQVRLGCRFFVSSRVERMALPSLESAVRGYI